MTAFKYLGKKSPKFKPKKEEKLDDQFSAIDLSDWDAHLEKENAHFRGALKEAAKEILRFAENYGDSDPQYTLYNEMPRIAKMVLVSAGENEER